MSPSPNKRPGTNSINVWQLLEMFSNVSESKQQQAPYVFFSAKHSSPLAEASLAPISLTS